ncbi:MAG: rod shape-determining protein MreD [Lachnospiraceae bacterium]
MKRKVIIAVVVLISFLLQTTIFPSISFLNAVPNFLLIVTFSLGFLEGKVVGMVVGFIGGLLLDVFYSDSVGFYALFYMYAGYITGMLSSILVTDIIVLPLILCIITDFSYHMYVYVFRFLIKRRLAFMEYLKEIVMPELLLTVLASIIIYGILMLIDKALREAEKKEVNVV